MKCLIVTDLHHSDLPAGALNRHRAAVPHKLENAFAAYTDGCDCVVCLGDIADGLAGCMPQKQALGQICDLFDACRLPVYVTFGNHDTAIPKKEFMRMTRMPDRFYAFETPDCLCLMLDSCINDRHKPYPDAEVAWRTCLIDDEQLGWLRAQLAAARKPVVIFTHILLSVGDTGEEEYLLKNADEVQAVLLEHEDKVAAILCGHYHRGMETRIGAIPFAAIRSLGDGTAVTCAVAEVRDGRVTVTGYGEQKFLRSERALFSAGDSGWDA